MGVNEGRWRPDPATVARIDQGLARYSDVIVSLARSSDVHIGCCRYAMALCPGIATVMYLEALLASLPPEEQVIQLRPALGAAIRLLGNEMRKC